AATADATRDAIADSTEAATHAATVAAIADATADATDAATRFATEAAIAAATRDAIADAATDAATRDATAHDLNRWFRCGLASIVRLATERGWNLQAASQSWWMRNGGNQWSAWVAYLSFFRHVAQLQLDYSKWQHYEAAAIHSGPRYMHAEFCIVSDRPERLLVDADNRPHCDDGPFCRWRDGSALYAVHGVRVPAWIVEHPERITIDAIRKEGNVEVRRVMIDRFGMARYIAETRAKVIDADFEGCRKGAAPRVLIQTDVGRFLVGTDGGTARTYYMEVPEEVTTCRAAHEALCGFEESRIICKS
ncbi:MAG TPA: hypothetical protein VK001_12855, partial [Geminicoccaceae bacterium]|nr:hypothetical protein [Geminicoccaceae bacterium]